MRSAMHCAESLASESWSQASSMVCGMVSMSWIRRGRERRRERDRGRWGGKEERGERGKKKRGRR